MTTPMNPYAKKPVIRVDNKAMFATIRFPAPAEGESAPQYDVDTLENMLAQEGIVYGIDRNMLSSLCQEILLILNSSLLWEKSPWKGSMATTNIILVRISPRSRPSDRMDLRISLVSR